MTEPTSSASGVKSLPAVLVVMGVSGSGKSTIAAMLAQKLGWTYQDGDWFHPPSNVEKMAAGTPLTDADRWPWLEAIARWIDETREAGQHGIVACSALRRAYREVLAGTHRDAVLFVFLDGSKDLIARRVGMREGHFMPGKLLDSQFATLERPAPDENAITVSIDASPQEITETIARPVVGGTRA